MHDAGRNTPRFVIPTPAGAVGIVSLTRRRASARARSAVLLEHSFEPLALSRAYRSFVSQSGPIGLVDDAADEATYVLSIGGDIDSGNSWNLPVLLFHLHQRNHAGIADRLAGLGKVGIFATGSLAFDPARDIEAQEIRSEAYALDHKIAAWLAAGTDDLDHAFVFLPPESDAGALERAERCLREAISAGKLHLVRCHTVAEAIEVLAAKPAAPARPASAMRRAAIAAVILTLSAATLAAGVSVLGLEPDVTAAQGLPVTIMPSAVPAKDGVHGADLDPQGGHDQPSIKAASAATAPGITAGAGERTPSKPTPDMPAAVKAVLPAGGRPCFALVVDAAASTLVDVELVARDGYMLLSLPPESCGFLLETKQDVMLGPALAGDLMQVAGADGSRSFFFRAGDRSSARRLRIAGLDGGWLVEHSRD